MLERPKGLRTDVLEELRQKLGREDFSEKTLQRAHQLVYKRVLVDIISMIKHGARKETSLLTAEERVDKLTQSIIAKAFRGELVPQDPNDPPASELLERIEAEREKLEAEKSKRKIAAHKNKTKRRRGPKGEKTQKT